MQVSDVKEKLSSKFEDKEITDYWAVGALTAIFFMALYLRYLPEQGMQYLQALDPYLIFKVSKHLALEGNIPVLDFMRYFPYATPSYVLNQGDIIFPAIFYWMGPSLFMNYLEWGQLYPALMGSLSVVVTYFLGKETFDRITGVSAAFFLATIPGIMHRTSAGFFEKEPTGSFFMLTSMYFFTRSWKRESWISGIMAGLTLGFFSISWGGSKMIWLLYPMVVGIMLWINEDIRKLVMAYTPTVLVGGIVASAMNSSRFWFTDSLFLVNLGMMALLWSRYAVEEFNILEEKHLGYYVPSVSILGLVMLYLSPLYSQWVYVRWSAALRMATQSTGGVIAGTVAENTPSSLGQLSGQLGATSSAQAYAFLSGIPQVIMGNLSSPMWVIAHLNGAWPLAFIGIIFLGSTVTAMIFRKFGMIDKTIKDVAYYKIVAVATLAWTMIFSIMFTDVVLFQINRAGRLMIGAAAPALLSIIGGSLIIYGLQEFGEREIEFNWYYLLPLFWAITNILGAVSRSRLVFLAAFPAAFMAGYTFAFIYKKLRSLSDESIYYLSLGGVIVFVDVLVYLLLTSNNIAPIIAVAAIAALNGVSLVYFDTERLEQLQQGLDLKSLRVIVLGLVVLSTATVNLGAGFASASQLGGSPNSLWMQNLDYMEKETPEGSTILSWWDYGYWFESIGRRAAVADGGNLNYYSNSRKINYPLADFLTSSNPENHTDFLKKHSVDYIVLDETMIGKYSAVSQISHESNKNYNSMIPMSTTRDIRRSISQSGNRTTIRYTRYNLQTYLPVNISNDGSVEVTSAPVFSTTSGYRANIDCVLTENGVKEFENVSQPVSLNGVGEVCVAFNPFYSTQRALVTASNQQYRPQQAKIALVPKKIMNSTLVRLYLMDGYNVPFAEKVEEGSNGYVRMWKVNLEE